MAQRRVGAFGKLLANYAADDAIIAAGEAAELLFCRAVAWLSTADSDGYITDAQLLRYVGAGMKDAKKRADTLVRHGLWLREGDGYQVRSYLKINESAEEKGRKRRTDRERKRAQSPGGIQSDSERNPDGIRNQADTESLTALSVTSVGTEAVQSTKSKGENESAEADSPPSMFCSKHPNGTEAPCGPCGTAKRRYEAWLKAEGRRAADERRARETCPDCGGGVWLDDGTKCTHPRTRRSA